MKSSVFFPFFFFHQTLFDIDGAAATTIKRRCSLGRLTFMLINFCVHSFCFHFQQAAAAVATTNNNNKVSTAAVSRTHGGE